MSNNNLEYTLSLRNVFSPQINQARNSLGQFQRSVNSVDGSKINSLGQNFAGLATKIAAAFTAWYAGMAVFSGLGKSLNLAADLESTQVAFKTLVGSSTKAAEVLGKIKKLGAETPFEFPELANAGRMLIAFGESADTVPDSLRRIGDVASGIQAPIGEIAEIYGKARTQGTLFAEDINQMTGRGIPIIGQFAKILGVSEGAVKDLASEGKITFTLLDQAFRNMTATGGQFHNMMQEQSATSNGLMSTLKDGVNDLFLAFGQPISEALKPILQDSISLVGRLQPMIATLGQSMAPALTAVREFIAEAESGGSVIDTLGSRVREAFEGLADVAMVPFRAMAAGIPGLGAALMSVVVPVGDYLALKFESLALRFGSIMAEQVARIADALPFGAGKKAAVQMRGTALGAGLQSDISSGQADAVAASLPGAVKGAADELMRSVTAMKDAFKSELGNFSNRQAERASQAEEKQRSEAAAKIVKEGRGDKTAPDEYIKTPGAIGRGVKKKAPALSAADQAFADANKPKSPQIALPAVTAKKAEEPKKPAIATPKVPTLAAAVGVTESGQSGQSNDRYDAEGRRADGRKQIRSDRDGSTVAKQTRGFGSLYGGDFAQKKPGSPNFTPPNPKLTPPGVAKAQSQERREAAATAQRGSVEKSRWDAVVAIDKKLSALGLAS